MRKDQERDNKEDEIDWLGMFLDQVGYTSETRKKKIRQIVEEKEKKLDLQEKGAYEFKPMILRILDSFMREIQMETKKKAEETDSELERGRMVMRYIDASIAGSWVHSALKKAIEDQ